jgi:hypothetical protein
MAFMSAPKKQLSSPRTAFLGLCLFATSLLCSSVSADVIYDNAANITTNNTGTPWALYPNAYEAGDQIQLAGTARYLTNFVFIYSTIPYRLPFAGSVQVRLRMYVNDGAPYNGYPAPATLFVDSGWLPVDGAAVRSNKTFTLGSGLPSTSPLIPSSDITWSVQVQRTDPNDAVALHLFNPPVVGSSYPDYWQNDGVGDWQLVTNVFPINLGAYMEASPVPATAPPPLVRPLLQVDTFGNLMVLSWPVSATNFVLEASTVANTADGWTPLTNGIILSGTNYYLTNSMVGPGTLYRLRNGP